MEKQHFFYREDGELKQIFPAEIVFIITENKYTNFYINGARIMVRITLDDAMKMLPPNMFIRISRSVAVATQYITRVTRENVYTKTIPEQELPISKQYYAALLKQIVILQTNPNPGRKKKEASAEEDN
jgi:DNA-binding LytR/AlgR family response regulator